MGETEISYQKLSEGLAKKEFKPLQLEKESQVATAHSLGMHLKLVLL